MTVSSTFSRDYYRTLKEDCAAQAVTLGLSFKIHNNPYEMIDPRDDFWGKIALRFAIIGEYKYIRKAIKIVLFVVRSNHAWHLTDICTITRSLLHGFTNEEISALISDCELKKQVYPSLRRSFILEMVRRNAQGFFLREWLSAKRNSNPCPSESDFYVRVATERAGNHDPTSIEEATCLAECLTQDYRQDALRRIILEKFRMKNLLSLTEPLEVTTLDEALEWLSLFRHPKRERLFAVMLGDRAVRGDPNAVDIAVQTAKRIKNKSERYIAYHVIVQEVAKQPGGEASLAAWRVFKLIPKGEAIGSCLLSGLIDTFLQKKDRQSFILARQIPKQAESKEEQDLLTRDFIRGLAARATNTAWAGSLIKLTKKMHSTEFKREILEEIGKQIARNCDDETGQVVDKIARELDDEPARYQIACTVIMELAKKKIVPIPTVLALATKLNGWENRDTVLQEIAIQSAKRSSSSEESMTIASLIETKNNKAEAYCGIAIAELDADSPDAPAKAFKTAQLITECIPRTFALLMIEMKCDEQIKKIQGD